MYKRIAKRKSLIVITVSGIAEEVVFKIADRCRSRFIISGIVLLDQDQTGKMVKGIPVVSSVKTVKEYVCHAWVDEIFIKIPDTMEYPKSLIDAFTMMGIKVYLELSGREKIKQRTEELAGYRVASISKNRESMKQVVCKRIMDIVGGVIGCLLTLIVFVFIAPTIYIQSPGPILFSQTRIGHNGRKFEIYKFRSMHLDAEKQKEEFLEESRTYPSYLMFKLDDDPRVIGSGKYDRHGRPGGIGNFIRRTSLDEFPQFWNVLKGQMSLVGTRPPTVDEWERYEPHHRRRMAIKPGITGMWQVSGRNDIIDFEEVVKLDTQYIDHWSIGLDCKIILKTFGVLFRRNGL